VTRRTAMSLFMAFIVLAAAGSYGYHALISGDGAPPKILVNVQPAAAKGDTGELAVIVKTNAQRASGIEVAPLATSPVSGRQVAYVTVLDLKSLFDLHNSYATARADRDAAKVQADTSAAQYDRQRTLYQDSRATSQKSMQDAQAAMNNDEAKLKVTEVALNDLAASAREQFGDALASAVTDKNSDLFAKLAQRQASVLLVSFPPDAAAPVPAEITVDGPQQQAIAASKLSVAPQADPSVQGNSYLYLASASLPLGTRTIAHAPSGSGHAQGLFIPNSAVVWYGGQQWVYVKTGTARFVRRPVDSAASVASGLIVTNGFKAGDTIVVQGAQLLLSQELKPKDITTECKDPPECDD
jgi:membrane fusion protein, multidrug efflux system